MELTLTFTDPKKIERESKYKQVIQVPQSQETYIPEDMRDASLGMSNRRKLRR